MDFFKPYFNEARFLNKYIIGSLAVILISYSVYAFLNADIVAWLGSEDSFFEWLTAISFLVVSAIFGFLFPKRRNVFYLVFSIAFFIGFGEEISWGQRVFDFRTPDLLHAYNVQKEFNLHNLELLNRVKIGGEAKSGISRLLEINLLFKIFTIIFAVLLPLSVYHSRKISSLTSRIKLPVPPVTISVFFVLNWLTFKLILDYFLPEGKIFQYYDTDTEIFEFVSAFIILIIAFYFLNKRHLVAPGKDVKQVLEMRASASDNRVTSADKVLSREHADIGV